MSPTATRKAWIEHRWELLATWEVNRDRYRSIYHLGGCKTCDGGACVGRSYSIAPLGFTDWPACPVSLVRSPWWRHVVTLHNAKEANPLADWPRGYPAWIVDALEALQAALWRKAETDARAAGLPPK